MNRYSSANYAVRLTSPAKKQCLACFPGYSLRPRELGNEWRFQPGSEEARVRVASNVVVNNSEVVRDLLLAGMGIGLVWNYAVDREIADGRLVALLPDWSPVGPFGQTAYALWLPQTHLPPKIRVFVDFLAERLRETPAGNSPLDDLNNAPFPPGISHHKFTQAVSALRDDFPASPSRRNSPAPTPVVQWKAVTGGAP